MDKISQCTNAGPKIAATQRAYVRHETRSGNKTPLRQTVSMYHVLNRTADRGEPLVASAAEESMNILPSICRLHSAPRHTGIREIDVCRPRFGCGTHQSQPQKALPRSRETRPKVLPKLRLLSGVRPRAQLIAQRAVQGPAIGQNGRTPARPARTLQQRLQNIGAPAVTFAANRILAATRTRSIGGVCKCAHTAALEQAPCPERSGL